MKNKGKIKITLPDGATRTYEAGIRGIDIAENISKSLSKKAIAIEVNGQEMDLCEKMFDEMNIKPLIGVIPDNKDISLNISLAFSQVSFIFLST